MRARIVARTSDVLAECPVWDAVSQRLHWIDIERGLMHSARESGDDLRTIRFPERIGSFAPRVGGGFIVALEHGIALCGNDGEGLSCVFSNPEPRGTTRFNDGKCDPSGRFWAGTLDLTFSRPLGSLYCFDWDLTGRRVIPDICISNGLAWSPDGRWLYFADSVRRRVERYPFDLERGTVGDAQAFVDTSAFAGVPDGATVSRDGRYWLAVYDGACILVIDADGRVLAKLDLPVCRPTCCAFGGPDMRTLFVTCAEDVHGVRGTGFEGASVLALDVDAEGLPAAAFTGGPT